MAVRLSCFWIGYHSGLLSIYVSLVVSTLHGHLLLYRNGFHVGEFHHRVINHDGNILQAHVIDLWHILNRVANHFSNSVKTLILH